MSDELPPRIPPELQDLDRLISLLGTLAKGVKLRHGKEFELRALADGFPSGSAQAARWKHHLKELRVEMAAEPDPEGEA